MESPVRQRSIQPIAVRAVDAGWRLGEDGIRERDGVRLSVLYQTSTNDARQGTQELIQEWWEEIGVETE